MNSDAREKGIEISANITSPVQLVSQRFLSRLETNCMKHFSVTYLAGATFVATQVVQSVPLCQHLELCRNNFVRCKAGYPLQRHVLQRPKNRCETSFEVDCK